MKYIVGIDEVGRGPLAGPVVVCAVNMPKNLEVRIRNLGAPRDSKKLSEKQRDEWFKHLTKHPKIRFAIAKVSPGVIDRINISRAANRAAFHAFSRLTQSSKLKPQSYLVYLDGGLYIGNKKMSLAMGANTVVRADDKISAVSVASIIAKVTRDRFMARLAKQHPQYGFEVHKGYGTLRHRKAIRKHGASKAHRLSFLGRI